MKGFAFDSSMFQEKGIRVIRISDTTRDSVKVRGGVFISATDTEQLSQFKLQANDVLLSTVGSRPPLYDSMVGKAVLVPPEVEGALLNQNLVRLFPKSSDTVDQNFLYITLKTQKFVDFIGSLIRGNANQVSITLKELFKFEVSLPTFNEQRKIADILSTWDKAIEQQTRLLELKRERKRGLMQQLLTGKVRFKEFEGLEWETFPFSKLAKHRSHKFEPQKSNESRPCIELEHIEQGSGRLMGSVESLRQTSTKNVFQAGDVLFGKLRPYLRKFWRARFNGVCSTEIWVLVSSDRIDSGFLFYLVQSQEFMAAVNVSSGSKMPRAEWKHLVELPFTIPGIAEQIKIAAVLSAADAELETLETQLAALRTQKRGLMQRLLTGKTRVKVDAAPAEAAVLP